MSERPEPIGRHIAGVDEAGRGPLAGPVVAAAVILTAGTAVQGLKDSKALSAARRAELAIAIKANAVAWQVAWADAREIDTVNILQASLLAMRRAVLALEPMPDHVIVDGNRCPDLGRAPCTVEAVVGGDRHVEVVSAASILAKEYRDAWMLRYHERYPQYGFDQHKGYPTKRHLASLKAHGPCPIHRYTFGPVRRCEPHKPEDQ